jgi:hypothetical protein
MPALLGDVLYSYFNSFEMILDEIQNSLLTGQQSKGF